MKKVPFSQSVESWHAYPYSTCRQVEISFLGMPQIAHFQVEKWKRSLVWEGTRGVRHTGVCRSNRSLFLEKSLNIGYGFELENLKHTPPLL